MGQTSGGSTMQHVGARVCKKLSARKVALRAGIQSANAMGCGFTHKLHDEHQFGDNEVRRQHSLLAPMVTLGTAHAPHNLASASGQWTLPDGSRAGSLLFQGQSRIAKQKRSVREKLAKCISWCWKQPSRRAASRSSRFCGKKVENPFRLIRE